VVAIKIKIVSAKDFIEVTADGVIDLANSRRLLAEIAKAEREPVDYELLIDFRDTESHLSLAEIYELAAELSEHNDIFRGKVALLVMPGLNFNQARFFETCSHNRGFLVDAFTDYEKAMRWILASENPADSNLTTIL
jgi:hypothetical protein